MPENPEPVTLLLSIIAAFIAGFAKTGISGVGILAVPLMASVFPGKASTGVLLPMLVMADLMAITVYRRRADWKILMRVFPFAAAGIIIGTFFMMKINNATLKPIIGVMVLLVLLLNDQ